MLDLRGLDALARRQHGLVTRSQLDEAGLEKATVRHLVRLGALTRVRRGVYQVCGIEPTWRGAVLAAVLAAGEGVVASHRTAAALWLLVEPEAGLEVTSPHYRRLEGVTCHRHLLDPRETTTVDRIPVTTIERTLLDLAESTDARSLGKAIDSALRRQLTSVRRLAAAESRRPRAGRRRSAPFVEALAARGLAYHPGANGWELRMDRLWDALGLPEARRQHRVHAGGRTYRVDRAILSSRIAVEWNGFATHGTRSGFEYDTQRKAHLSQAGWYVLEFTPGSTPELIRETVLAVHGQRARLYDTAASTP
jgi:very-short-patch-repair endonuclease